MADGDSEGYARIIGKMRQNQYLPRNKLRTLF